MDFITRKLIEQQFKNLTNFKMDMSDPKIIKKMKGIGKRYGFSKPYDLDAIDFFVRENYLAMIYGIDSNKQTRHEKWALELLRTKFDDVTFRTKKSVMIENGTVIQPNEAILIGRGVDFVIQYRNYSIYALHVYTRGTGGAQDSCYREVIKFIEKALPMKESSKLICAVLLDGDYYDEKKMGYLQNKYCSKNMIVSDTENFIKNIDLLLSRD